MTVSKKERNFHLRQILGLYMGALLICGGSYWLPRSLDQFELPITFVGTVLTWYCLIWIYRDFFRWRALRKLSETSERGSEA